ncbi:MAG: hypothetical protein LBU84_15755, partial [Prevotella sp.]|nr:hypothetical protein [Prevotella sp.]
YTVIQNTGIKHGNYKSYFEDGFLECVANFKYNLLHGACEVHERFILQITVGTYNNGKKNGEWSYYARNRTTGKKEYLEKKEVYKEDVIVANTTYYPSSKKKFHAEQVGDMKYYKKWYEDGTLESEATYKVTVGNYGENETPVNIINYNSKGVVIAKQENDITYIYSDDGTALLTKEDKQKKHTENYSDGEITQTIQEYRDHNDRTVFEVIEYKNGEKLSRKVIDANGQDMEAKYEKDNLVAEYKALRNQLDNYQLVPISRVIIENNSNGGCRKSKYESDKLINKLLDNYNLHKSALDKITSSKQKYSIMLDKVDNDQLKSLQDYITQIEEYYLPRKGMLLNISRKIQSLSAKLYQIECEYILAKNQYKGTTYIGSTIEVKHKKNLYNDYALIADYLISKISDTNNLSEVLLDIQQYNIISDNLLKWKNVKTSDIEKQLKNAKTVQEKLEIFLSGGAN